MMYFEAFQYIKGAWQDLIKSVNEWIEVLKRIKDRTKKQREGDNLTNSDYGLKFAIRCFLKHESPDLVVKNILIKGLDNEKSLGQNSQPCRSEKRSGKKRENEKKIIFQKPLTRRNWSLKFSTSSARECELKNCSLTIDQRTDKRGYPVDGR